jgi:hypothetical protein
MESEKTHVNAEQEKKRNDGEYPEEPAPVQGFSLVFRNGQYVLKVDQRFQ